MYCQIRPFLTSRALWKKVVFTVGLIFCVQFYIPAQELVYSGGLYFTDQSQTMLYTGRYSEFYPDGMLKLEMNVKEGHPEGIYVVYFPNGRIREVRSYSDGLFNGVWRTYDANGTLIAEACYEKGVKQGIWRIWDESGMMRYEMNYTKGRKTGHWYMWDEKGRLVSDKLYPVE